MVVSVHVGTITIPILLVRKLSLGPETQPVSNNAQTPTWVHMAPKLGVFPHSLHCHTPTTEAPISRTLSCTPTPQASHTPLRLPTHTCTHTYTSSTPTYSHKPSDRWLHTPLRHITPTHTSTLWLGDHTLSQLRDLLCSPQTHDSDTGPPPRKNRSRTNSFWE